MSLPHLLWCLFRVYCRVVFVSLSRRCQRKRIWGIRSLNFVKRVFFFFRVVLECLAIIAVTFLYRLAVSSNLPLRSFRKCVALILASAFPGKASLSVLRCLCPKIGRTNTGKCIFLDIAVSCLPLCAFPFLNCSLALSVPTL